MKRAATSKWRLARKGGLPRKGKRKRSRVKAVRRFTAAAVNKMVDQAHTNGYKVGFRDGKSSPDSVRDTELYNMRYEEGRRQGLYDGGDAVVDRMLPFDVILPEVSIEQIIEAGLNQLQPQYYTLQNAGQVADRIQAALDSRSPFSLVRLGDGEVLTMAQESVMSIEEVQRAGHFLSYAGVDVPDLAARDMLVQAVRQATCVGIPKLRNHTYQPLAFQVLRAHGIDYRSLSLTHSLVNYYIYKVGRLGSLLRGRNVLLIGNKASQLAEVMNEHGIRVTGVISPVHGVKDIGRIMGLAHGYSFDIALVSSGIAAVMIAQRIASEMGKVAVDFGHLADALANRSEPFH